MSERNAPALKQEDEHMRGPYIWACAMLLVLGVASADRGALAQKGARGALIDELVTANRILANENVLDAYGHVSVRNTETPSHFFLSRTMPSSLVTAADIIEYDLDSRPIVPTEAGGYNERFIHGEIYRARPDVMAVVHMHAPEIVSFSASSVPLRPIFHLAAFIGEGVPKFEIRDAEGVADTLVRSPQLGRALAQTLADKPAALMRGHGAVAVAPSVHIAVGRAYYMALNARLQAQAIALGGDITYLSAEQVEKAGLQDEYERAWALWKSRVTK